MSYFLSTLQRYLKQHILAPLKVYLTPTFLLLMKNTSFFILFQRKKLSQLIKSLWFYRVRPLLMFSKGMAQNTEATFDWVSSVLKSILGICASYFIDNGCTNTNWSLAMISMAVMFIFFPFCAGCWCYILGQPIIFLLIFVLTYVTKKHF